MAKLAVEFRTSRGGDPVHLAVRLGQALQPTAEDIQEALENQRTRILERTARGVDFEEKPFAPYSRNGPYYHYPSEQRGKTFLPTARALRQIWAGRSTFRGEYFRTLRASAQRLAGKLSGVNGAVTPGGGIRFDSYAAFKESLGRSTVDLTGRTGYMLRAMVVRVRSATEGAIGIYQVAEAERASGHHDGVAKTKLPRRRFLGANAEDRQAIVADLADSARRRARGVLGE